LNQVGDGVFRKTAVQHQAWISSPPHKILRQPENCGEFISVSTLPSEAVGTAILVVVITIHKLRHCKPLTMTLKKRRNRIRLLDAIKYQSNLGVYPLRHSTHRIRPKPKLDGRYK
jgi:hypothetical protein